MGNGLNTLSRGGKASAWLFHTVSCMWLPLCAGLFRPRRGKCDELGEVLDIPSGYHQFADGQPCMGFKPFFGAVATADIEPCGHTLCAEPMACRQSLHQTVRTPRHPPRNPRDDIGQQFGKLHSCRTGCLAFSRSLGCQIAHLRRSQPDARQRQFDHGTRCRRPQPWPLAIRSGEWRNGQCGRHLVGKPKP